MIQKHCWECGAALIEKSLEGEGIVPFCPVCGEYRFPMYNAAVSMIVVDENTGRILLIQQYGRPSYILVAGYINRGESAEDAVRREILEEVPLGATRMVVHCGGQGKLTRDRAMRNSHANVKNILRALDEAHLTGCTVCLETMGKKSVLGTAEEVCELVAADDRLLPCIDFGHLNCRTGGRMNTREEVAALFDLMENTIGRERTAKLHAHFSHIEYNDKGEVRHLTFADTVYGPDFAPVAAETAVRGYTPTFICESAGTQAEDALSMKRCYQTCKGE